MRHLVVLAGGRGKRFWPRSRRSRPKQLMPFEGDRSLLQMTADRLTPVVPPKRQWVITNRDYRSRVRRDLPHIPPDQVIGEPRGLNTAPAIGLAAALIRERDPDAVMMVQGADHWIRDVKRFQRLVEEAFRQVERRRGTALIGFPPSRPAVGYGYIERGDSLKARRGFALNEVAAFKEKPSAAVAERYFRSGRHLWNGCMFFWHATTILDGIGRHLPEFGVEIERLAAGLAAGKARGRLIGALYRRAEAAAIEPAVVERMRTGLFVLEGDCGWEDVGTWGSLAELLPVDESGNVVQGTHYGVDTESSLILSDRGAVVTIGVRDLIVVKDGDAVLVLPREREGELRDLVDNLERDGRFDRLL